jgi:hypothetical protein
MENEDILALIYELQLDIFDGQFQVLSEKLASLSTGLNSVYRAIPAKNQQYFKQILLALLKAFESRDYLLLADILEFELKPLLVDVFGEGEQHGNV